MEQSGEDFLKHVSSHPGLRKHLENRDILGNGQVENDVMLMASSPNPCPNNNNNNNNLQFGDQGRKKPPRGDNHLSQSLAKSVSTPWIFNI